MEKETARIKSLAKSMRILELFTSKQPEWSITQLAEETGLYKSNVYAILSTFESMGYITQKKDNNKYRLGLKILQLSHAITTSMGFRDTIYPHMVEISAKVGETVFMAIMDNTDVFYLDAAYPTGSILGMPAITGERVPLYCTGVGKALLAGLPGETWKEHIPKNPQPFTEKTITDVHCMEHEIGLIRQQGYSVDNMEHVYGIRCVAVGLKNRNHETVGAISISAPSPRLDDQKVIQYAKLLEAKAGDLKDAVQFLSVPR